LSAEVGPVRVDPVQLEQMLMNLFINARDAVEEHGNICVTLSSRVCEKEICDACHADISGEYVELTVGDSGPGVVERVQEKMFDPFFTTKEVGKGSGMGLAVVHGIMHECGGHILVIKRYRGDSSCCGNHIQLLFPVVREVEAIMEEQIVAEEEEEIDWSSLSGRVLVVDDEPAVLDYLGELLANYILEVRKCANGEEALALFKEDPKAFDVVVTDQTMPKLTGVKLAEELLTIRPDIPIILCTGYSAHVDEAKAAALGIRGFLMKPVESQRLLVMIRDLLHVKT
jgi:CheY-like chemotaxis protein